MPLQRIIAQGPGKAPLLIRRKYNYWFIQKKRNDGSGKQNTTDVIVNQIEFLDSKKESNTPSANNFADFPDNDVFTPVDDSEDIPF